MGTQLLNTFCAKVDSSLVEEQLWLNGWGNLYINRLLVLRGVLIQSSHDWVSAPLYRFKDLVAEALKKLKAIKEERVKKVSSHSSVVLVN